MTVFYNRSKRLVKREKRYMKKFILFIGMMCLGWGLVSAQIPATEKERLTTGWEFLKSDLGGIWEAVRPGGASESVPLWSNVTLPHCFNAEDGVDPETNYYQGPGWYRTRLKLQNPYPGGRIILEFEGAGQKTDVYVYTTKVGSHVGGYDEWNIDMTDAVNEFLNSGDAARFKGAVPVSVRCDNSRDLEMIPSDLSDFNLYGGLYRCVNLIYLPQVSLKQIEVNPVLEKNLKKGYLEIKAAFYNPAGLKEAVIDVLVKDPQGNIIVQEEKQVLPLGEKTLVTATVKTPVLWDVDKPRLYTCELIVKSGGQQMKASTKFGFRHFEFIDKGPFMLNGRRLLLRGTHRHEDHAGVAAAMTAEQIVREMEMMKDMGVNFIRLGHYQQSSLVLEECDRLGILVWEEIPWCRGGVGGEKYRGQARRMLQNMITQHRNHPSVIIWGLGNENDWPNDFPQFNQSEIRAFMSELNALSHRLDSGRMTAIRRCDFCKDIVDVYSPSIWAGWYRGKYADYAKMSEAAKNSVNHFLHVEWGGDSHAGRHLENISEDKIKNGQKDGQWSESYIVRLIDWHLKEQEKMPWLTGAAYWPFKDFSTPVRPENPVPYVNQKGVVQRDLNKKESYYVFQSYWTASPMIHIYGHTWPVRWGEKGEKKEILVYSNCREAELFVNGRSQGVRLRNSQDFPGAGLRWQSVLNEGKNEIRVVGTTRVDGKKVTLTDSLSWEYQTAKWGKPENICLKSVDCGNGQVKVEVQLTDRDGIPCLDACHFIRFEIAGDGSLVRNQGTMGGSSKVQACNGRAFIMVNSNGGESTVAVKSEHLKTKFINIPAR